MLYFLSGRLVAIGIQIHLHFSHHYELVKKNLFIRKLDTERLHRIVTITSPRGERTFEFFSWNFAAKEREALRVQEIRESAFA